MAAPEKTSNELAEDRTELAGQRTDQRPVLISLAAALLLFAPVLLLKYPSAI